MLRGFLSVACEWNPVEESGCSRAEGPLLGPIPAMGLISHCQSLRVPSPAGFKGSHLRSCQAAMAEEGRRRAVPPYIYLCSSFWPISFRSNVAAFQTLIMEPLLISL